MNCERSGSLKPLNEAGVGEFLRLFMCDGKPEKPGPLGVVNCSLALLSEAAKTKPH